MKMNPSGRHNYYLSEVASLDYYAEFHLKCQKTCILVLGLTLTVV